MAYLRLSSGTAMLKICEQKGVGDQFTPEQFCNLSRLMVVSNYYQFIVICIYEPGFFQILFIRKHADNHNFFSL